MNTKKLPTLLKLPLLFLAVTSICSCRVGSTTRSNLDKAEELMRQDKYDEAIEVYSNHLQDRLSMKDRAEWENPYFYYLLIGDIELRRSNVDGAIKAYETARDNHIHTNLISDRMRYVASWYEEKGEFEKAIEVLKKYRELDPLLFDAVLDRLSKEIIWRQDEQLEQPPIATATAQPASSSTH